MNIVNEHRKGAVNPSVILLEFGDYECPYSAKLAPIIEDLLEEFDSELAFIFRHSPMVNIHPSAGLAAITAEAAHVQGKFWKMHHLLFQNQSSLNLEKILAIAKTIEIKIDDFLDAIEGQELWERVEQNIESGIVRDVVATPSIYINGKFYDGPSEFDEIKKAIEIEIERRAMNPLHP